MFELSATLEPSRLYNSDLAPTTMAQRTWSRWNIAALWVGMSVCIPTYMLASFMISAGIPWVHAMGLVLFGNLIVLLPMMINAHAGTKYGIPFPVYLRTAFGFNGANVPALMRAAVACGWFGIQTWIGGEAITKVVILLWPGFDDLGGGAIFLGLTLPYWIGFLSFWAINMAIVIRGLESIKWMETLAAPFLLLVGLALLGWAFKVGLSNGGIGVLFANVPVGKTKAPGALAYFAWLTGMVGYWATLALNIPDFTRFAKSQRDQLQGQLIGMPTTMVLFAFIGVVVTAATALAFGKPIWNPVDLVARLSAETGSSLLGVVALIALAVATLSTNIAANVVSPANDISNLAPQLISFRTAGIITGLIGVCIMPWKLLDQYQGWLLTYSGVLGAVGGVIICDYVLINRWQVDLAALYQADSRYAYSGGFNVRALVALFLGIATPLVHHLSLGVAVTMVTVGNEPWNVRVLTKAVGGVPLLASGSWFFSFLAAFIVYYGLMAKRKRR